MPTVHTDWQLLSARVRWAGCASQWACTMSFMIRLGEGQAKAALITTGALWGTVGLFVRFLAVPSALLAFFRAAIALALIAVVLTAARQRPNWAAIRANLGLLAASGFAIGANWLFLFRAYVYTSVAVATLCNYLAPVYVVALSPLVLGEKLNVRKGACVLAALVGMVFVSGVLTEGMPTGREGLGVFFGLASGALYAVAVFLNKKMRDIGGIDMTLGQLFFAGLLVAGYLVATGEYNGVVLDARSLVIIAVVGIFHTGLAYVLYFTALERLPAQTVAAFSYIDPAVAIVLSWLVFSEPLSLLGWIGAALILGATFLADYTPSENSA